MQVAFVIAVAASCLFWKPDHVQAFSRAVDLDGARLYSKVQIGYIHLSLGAYPEAIAAFEAALEQSSDFGPACEGAASALLASARSHQSFGAPGINFWTFAMHSAQSHVTA